MARSFTYFNAGRLSHQEHDLFLFTCWNEDHTVCGSHGVHTPGLAENIEALKKAGYEDRSDYRWDYAKREWVAPRETAPGIGRGGFGV